MKPQVQFLSEEEITQIHQASLKILQETGMRFPAEEALDVLRSAGAEIVNTDTVRIPGDLVAQALEKAPKRNDVVLYGRDPEHDKDFRTHLPSLACMTMATNVIDPYTEEKRPATDEDLASLTRLADQLECVAVNGGLVTPQEVPGATNDWYTWATTIQNTTKHIRIPGCARCH